ncbi:MAG: hypothetical protein ACE5FA_13780, partial [Dehalococcoidia bacterium]
HGFGNLGLAEAGPTTETIDAHLERALLKGTCRNVASELLDDFLVASNDALTMFGAALRRKLLRRLLITAMAVPKAAPPKRLLRRWHGPCDASMRLFMSRRPQTA